MKKLKHFLSLDDYYNINGEFTANINCRAIHESTDNFSNDIEKLMKIQNQNVLVINDINFAERMSNNNNVVCIYFNKRTKLPVGSNVKFEFVRLKRKGKDIDNITKSQLDDIFSKYSDVIFGFIFNISPDTEFPITYEMVSNLILYIFESSVYISGITEFWSFDELDVVEQFNKKIYNLHGIRPRGVNQIDFSEWINYGFDNKDEKDRFMNVIIEKDNDTFYKRDLDKSDFLGATENTDNEHILKFAIEPMIYAFQTDVVDKLLNIHSLKVGDTDRGVDVRLKEWNKDYPGLVEQGRWSSVISGLGEALDGKVFRDKTLHKIIMNSKGRRNVGTKEEIEKLALHKIHYSNEFFENCTPQDIEDSIKILYDLLSKNRIDILSKLKDKNDKTKEFIYPLHNKSLPYSARELQQKVIDKFKDRFSNNYKQMLIYAVMRFGKTFVACECAKYFCEKKYNGRFILVVSSKTEVKNEWLGQINPYDNYINIDMYDSSNTTSGLLYMLHNKKEWIDKEKTMPGPHPGKTYETVDAYLKDYPNKNIMLFASLQDLDGNRQNFNDRGKKEATDKDYIKFQHQCFYDTPIDMIIIDEAHTGAEADSFGFAIGEGDKKNEKKIREILKEEEKDGVVTKKKFNEIMKTLKIENAIKLFLSGTPYNLLYDEHFTEDEIIGKFSFADLMKAKNDWIEAEEKKYEGDNAHIQRIDYSKNPYYGIPEMLNFGYNFNSFKLDQMKKMGVEYNFKTLFKTTGKTFDFEEDILNLFMAIDGSNKRNGVMDLLNLAEIRKGNMCKHIVIVLPFRKTCDAMELFLKKYKKKLKNLGQYEVINISGNSVKYDSESAKKMIYSFDKTGNKTISLTVNKLLTGVTVKPWDTMFYMKDGLSPQSYDQAKFRIQTPYIKEVPEIDISDDVKSVGILKNEKGEPIKRKIDMKPQTIFVDFSADRIFTLLHKRYIAELGARGITTESEGFESAYDALAAKDLKYLPIISTETGKLKRIKSKNIHEIIRTSLAHVYFSKSLNDLIAGIKWPAPGDKDIDNIKDYTETFDDKKKGKKNIKIETSLEDGDDFNTESVDSDEATETTITKSGRKHWKRMTPEEKKNLLYHYRKKCQTIMMNFAIYLLTRKDNTKILTWKNLFGDSMRNVDNIIDEQGNKIIRDGINVDIIINIFGDGIIPENFDERQEKVNRIKRELQYWKDYYLTKSPGLREEVLNRLVAMTGKYGENRNNFDKIKESLKSFANIGKTEFITPDDLSKKLLENVVIFNKDSKILDCYGSKIGEILNYISSNEKYWNDFNLSNYYLIVKNSMIAEICKVVFNITYEKQKKWNITHSSNKNKKFFELLKEDGSIDYRGTLTNREKDKFFNDHILIVDTSKEEKKERGKETTESVEPIIEARGDKTRIREREKTYYIELENAINNKWGENMKFDIIVGNPPYQGNLHLKIINTVIQYMNDNGVGSFIHPARWFEDPLVEYKKGADKIKFKNMVDRLDKVEFIDVKNVHSKFNIIHNGDLMISKINSQPTKKEIKLYNNNVNSCIDIILKYSRLHNLEQVDEKNKIDGWRCQIFDVIPVQNYVNSYNTRHRTSNLFSMNDEVVFYNGHDKEGNEWMNTRPHTNYGKPAGSPFPHSIKFDTEEEALNFQLSCNTNFYMNIIYLFKFDMHTPLSFLPWMKDYSHVWTDNDYCEFFGKLGLSKECQKWMCRGVYDYRIKDFIDYIHFDGGTEKIHSDSSKEPEGVSTERTKTRMGILKENPELKIRLEHSYNIFLDAGEDYDTSFEDYVNSSDCDKYFKDYENTR